ncbi:arylamine N-acetyltransferase [Streptomyces rectiverticillatus]|uniref:arylamine N-acetyltransferase family protein n=1 Tax=Streptomyces rectiverticillatus TaxID=173860 RepID=UPI0015C3E22F|nr:arylamine N-acetyltransferase [Streptomyces rectiverticillatus]QLE74594.1 arylamine N-acetyltransferase [Streptomyces rectiverticillatus]
MDSELDPQLTQEYLDRIGVTTIRAPQQEFLSELQERHLMSVPYENLGMHLGEPALLGDGAIDKVVRQRRGGGCQELNGAALSSLLRALGFRITLLSAYMFNGGRPSFALCHPLIVVDCTYPWFVDVGLGVFGPRHPLRMDLTGPQHDPQGTFEFVAGPDGDTDLLRNGSPILRIEDRPRVEKDFMPGFWWVWSSPESYHRTHVYCTRLTENGSLALRGDVLTRIEGTQKEWTALAESELAPAYEKYFGMTLDRLPPLYRQN